MLRATAPTAVEHARCVAGARLVFNDIYSGTADEVVLNGHATSEGLQE